MSDQEAVLARARYYRAKLITYGILGVPDPLIPVFERLYAAAKTCVGGTGGFTQADATEANLLLRAAGVIHE